jgi:hypothetical protein
LQVQTFNGVWDSEFEGSFDEEEMEIMEDVEYLKAVHDNRLPHDGNTRDDIQRDADIQAFFDNVVLAFRDVLNKISSTLQLLAVPVPHHSTGTYDSSITIAILPNDKEKCNYIFS